MAKREHYTFSDMETFVTKAAVYTVRRYATYALEFDDIAQEIRLWLYGAGEARVRNWLKSSPQQTTRIYRTMLDRALGYAEAEKAHRAGYSPDDVAWYSPTLVDGLIPLALDATFTGEVSATDERSGRKPKPASEGGDLLTMVVDIRSAVERSPNWVLHALRHSERGQATYDDAVAYLVDMLGGNRPHVGRRKAITNAAAQYLTGVNA